MEDVPLSSLAKGAQFWLTTEVLDYTDSWNVPRTPELFRVGSGGGFYPVNSTKRVNLDKEILVRQSTVPGHRRRRPGDM